MNQFILTVTLKHMGYEVAYDIDLSKINMADQTGKQLISEPEIEERAALAVGQVANDLTANLLKQIKRFPYLLRNVGKGPNQAHF